ncbi:MAG TPA: putative DNA modification/repair radical SAM protein [Lachnospiraceae bacterium]
MSTPNLSIMEKLNILADAAKYDVSCTSSGSSRKGQKDHLGATCPAGICHSFSADGRCISLLKVLLTNICIYDCKYCLNRSSNKRVRTSFTPRELCDLVIGFYQRNYIEGLFLSSGVVKSPDNTMELIYQTVRLLREDYHFHGYIHVKAIPNASWELIEKVGYLCDRMSINMEVPDNESLKQLAPHKSFGGILGPMQGIQKQISTHRQTLGLDAKMERSRSNRYLTHSIFQEKPRLSSSVNNTALIEEIKSIRSLPSLSLPDPSKDFVPAGQSTQMIIGSGNESDFDILSTTENLYRFFDLKRVFFSAYVPINEDSLLPGLDTPVPLLREHRLYQADWLLRFYGFQAQDLLSLSRPHFNLYIDPKCDWALRHLELFPVEVNSADYATLLKVPGIGVKSAQRIIHSRRLSSLSFEDLKKMGIVMKRAQYFITCKGKSFHSLSLNEDFITRQLIQEHYKDKWKIEHPTSYRQLSLFDTTNPLAGGIEIL